MPDWGSIESQVGPEMLKVNAFPSASVTEFFKLWEYATPE
jgi:hypothetical protein